MRNKWIQIIREKKFLDHDKLMEMRKNAKNNSSLDLTQFTNLIMKEKYEKIYYKLCSTTTACMNKGYAKTQVDMSWPTWLITSPITGAIFEIAMGGSLKSQINNVFEYIGTLNNKWRVYQDDNWPLDEMMIGFGFENLSPYYVGNLKLNV
jgi:hypothetical protein